MPEQPSRDLAVPEPATVGEAPAVGEIVEDEPAPKVVVLAPVIKVVTIVVSHPVPRAAGHIAAGAVVLWRRRRQGRTLAQRMARQAETAGDHANAALWHQKEADERHRRHERRIAVAEIVISLAKASPWIIGASAAGMFVLGVLLAIAQRSISMVAWPFETAARIAADVVMVASVTWLAVVALASAGVVLYLYLTGKHGGDLAPGWSTAAKQADEERGLVVTADGIVVALQNLPIADLKKAFSDKWQPSFRLTPVKDGEGYSAIFSLPMGVTPAMIADKNAIFARNLHRAKVEVWPVDAERAKLAPAGFVSLWVANPGVLDRPAPGWPLLDEGTADVFKGVPAGVTARGIPVLIPVVGNNFSIGGLMGQGKSNACRVVMLGAALDPLAELLVHVFAYNGDFDCFEPRLYRYVKGAGGEHIDAAMTTLNELQAELPVREQIIADLGAKKVTRQLAQKYPELRPRLTLFSECHELFGHKDYGEEATEIATSVERRARKLALWLGFDTQDSRKDAIPPKLLSLVSIRSCLPVTSWRANDGFLWDGAFKSGVRATELRPGRDVGRSITTGVSNEQFEILKWHYIFSDDDTGADDAAPVIARSMRQLAPGTRAAAGSPVLPAITVRDLLGDLAEVLKHRSGKVRVSELPDLLHNLAPSWGPYRGLSGVQLRKLLMAEGVPTTNPGNVPTLDLDDLAAVLAKREVS